MDPPAVALLRFLTMWAVLVPICYFRGLSLKYNRDDALRVLGAGMLAMGIYMVLFMQGMSLTSPAEGAIILATAPVLTYLISVAVRIEQFHWIAFISSCIAFIGVGLVILGGASSSGGSVFGNVVVLGSAVVWSGTVVFMMPLLHRYEATQLLTLSMPGGALIMIPFGTLSLCHSNLAAVTPVAWLMFLQVAILSGVVGFACYYLGVKQVGPSRTALYQYFVPPTAVFFAWILMGKTLSPVQGIGFGILLLGVVMTSRSRMFINRSGSSTDLNTSQR